MPHYFLFFLKNQKKYIFQFLLISILFTGFIVISGFFLSKALGQLPYILKDGDWNKFIFYLKILIAIEVISAILGILHTIIYTRNRGYMNIFVRIFGVDNLINLDHSKLAKLGSGKLLQIVKNGVDAYSFLIYDGLDKLIQFILRFLLLVFILSYFSSWFLLIFIIGFISIAFIQKFVYKKLTQVREKERQLNENYTKQTAKIFMNFILLKLANIKDYELKKLLEIGKQRVHNYIWLKFWFGAGARIMNFFISLVFIFSLYYFGKQYLAGNVSFDLILWISILFMFSIRVLSRISLFISELAEKYTYIERYDNLVSEVLNKPKKDNLIKDENIFKSFESINFENIWFKYEGQKLHLFENLNLTVKKGEKIVILGKSGSGKSSLFKILVRLIEPEKGDIYFQLSNGNKISLSQIDPEIIFQKVGYFYQEALVFDGTVKENLTLGILNIDENELKEVLKIVELDYLKLGDIIGERGLLLSGGERQRLALARIFLFDYEILLLDEPTSNLDLYLEKKILNEIFKKYKNKTILVVSHRPYVLENLERIILMKKGEILKDFKKENLDLKEIEKFLE